MIITSNKHVEVKCYDGSIKQVICADLTIAHKPDYMYIETYNKSVLVNMNNLASKETTHYQINMNNLLFVFTDLAVAKKYFHIFLQSNYNFRIEDKLPELFL